VQLDIIIRLHVLLEQSTICSFTASPNLQLDANATALWSALSPTTLNVQVSIDTLSNYQHVAQFTKTFLIGTIQLCFVFVSGSVVTGTGTLGLVLMNANSTKTRTDFTWIVVLD